MPKPNALDAKIAALAELEHNAYTPESAQALRKALGGAQSLLMARAAQAAAALDARDLASDLAAALMRLLAKPAKSDPGCLAKNALADALNALEHDDPAPFFAGARHVQMESAWGAKDGKEDAAPYLRGKCAFGLARLAPPGAEECLVDLLADPEPQARRGAVNALAYLGGQGPAWLLRLKVRHGDPDPGVIGDCLAALMALAPGSTLPLLVEQLDAAPETAEAAALALGESRHPEAFEALRAHWEAHVEEAARERLLLPLALLRSDASLDFLLEIVRDGPARRAAKTLDALSLYAGDAACAALAAQAAAARTEPEVRRALAESFGEQR